jgi:hypothetical protein
MHIRKIVGSSMRQTLHTEIALEAVNMAVERQRASPVTLPPVLSSAEFVSGGC